MYISPYIDFDYLDLSDIDHLILIHNNKNESI